MTLELHAADRDDAPTWDAFQRECECYLPGRIHAGCTLLVRRWKNRIGGERLHNRYILTYIGGVQFGVGLDDGDPGATDDVTRLDTDVYRRRMQDYSEAEPAVDLEGKIRILGQRID